MSSKLHTKQCQDRKREAGLCITCGQRPLVNKNHCDTCRGKIRSRSARRQKTDAASCRDRRERLFLEGTCIDCGAVPYVRGRKSCQPCLDKHNASGKKCREGKIAQGLCGHCMVNPLAGKSQCRECLDKKCERQKILKARVYHAYGGYICRGCGITDADCLTIDHVNNDGHLLRKIQGSGMRFYEWLVRNNFPTEYQVLCRNCQWKKHVNNGVLPTS